MEGLEETAQGQEGLFGEDREQFSRERPGTNVRAPNFRRGRNDSSSFWAFRRLTLSRETTRAYRRTIDFCENHEQMNRQSHAVGGFRNRWVTRVAPTYLELHSCFWIISFLKCLTPSRCIWMSPRERLLPTSLATRVRV